MQHPVDPALTPPIPVVPIAAPTAAADHRAHIAAAALGASALAMVVAFVSKAWFSAGPGGHVGLLGVEACKRRGCESMSWFSVKHVPEQIPWFATFALVAGTVALAFIVHAIVMLARGTPRAVQVGWLARTLGVAAGAATAFVVALSIGEPARGLSIEWGTFLGLGGIVAAGVVTTALVRPLARAQA